MKQEENNSREIAYEAPDLQVVKIEMDQNILGTSGEGGGSAEGWGDDWI